MMIHDITKKVGKHKLRMRVGRGEGSGKGGTSGRGHKGAKSRAGWTSRPGYQGGSTPLLRRFTKRGFKNAPFRVDYHVVNVCDLAKHFTAGSAVDIAALVKVGLVRDADMPLKVLGTGDVTLKLNVTADRFSSQARTKIEAAGGSATLTPKAAAVAQAEQAAAEADAAKKAQTEKVAQSKAKDKAAKAAPKEADGQSS